MSDFSGRRSGIYSECDTHTRKKHISQLSEGRLKHGEFPERRRENSDKWPQLGGAISPYRNNTVYDFVGNGEFAPSNIRSNSYYAYLQD